MTQANRNPQNQTTDSARFVTTDLRLTVDKKNVQYYLHL